MTTSHYSTTEHGLAAAAVTADGCVPFLCFTSFYCKRNSTETFCVGLLGFGTKAVAV